MQDTNDSVQPEIYGVMDKIIFREWDTYDLSEDAKLDKFALDIEAVKQAEFMNKWLGLLHKAQTILISKTEALKHVEAELRIKVKKEGVEGISKVTESVAESWIVLHPRYKNAMDEKNVAFGNVQYLQNARLVLENKRDMIKVLDHLWVAGYYARPNVSEKACENTDNEVKEVTKEQLGNALHKRLL